VIAANCGMAGYVLDIDNVQAIAGFAARLTADYLAINVRLNNAGVMKVETSEHSPIHLAIAEATVSTNLLGSLRLIVARLPHLRAQPRATMPLAVTPTYNATKAAIHSYSLSLNFDFGRHRLLPPACAWSRKLYLKTETSTGRLQFQGAHLTTAALAVPRLTTIPW
jgi:uncharacterized oxidoreductase